MSGWLLPAAASAFWGGLLAWSLHPPWARPWMGLAIGVSAFMGAWLAIPPTSTRTGPGVRARLGLEPDEPAPVAALRPGRVASGGASPAAMALALLGVWSIGAGWAGLAEARTIGSLPARLASQHVTAIGTLAGDPHKGGFGWFAVVDLGWLDWGSGAATLRSPVWAEWSSGATAAVRGDQVRLDGQLRLPDDPDFAASLLHQGIPVTLSADRFERIGPAPNPLVRAAQVTRRFAGRSIGRLFGPREAGLLLGLVLGDDRSLDPGVARDFQASGLGHLLVVSGENVAMVLAPVLAAAVVLRLGGRTRLLLGVGTVLFFTVLTGGEPSVLRAGVMATLTLVGVVLGRPRHGGSVLAGAVLVLLVIDPWLVWSVGFRLSVAATAGMVAMAGALATRLRFLPGPLALAAGATLAAQLGVAPILLFQFRAVPLVSLPANLLAFPAVAPALLLGIGAAALGLLSHPLGALVAVPASACLRYLEWLADRSAKAPLPSITSGGGIGVLLVGGAVVVAVAWWLRSPRRLPRAVATVVAIAVPVLVWSTALRAGPPGGLRIVFLDVGQGDAALIESPAGAHVLIDGGPDEAQVATDLASYGVRRLDLVVATHPHADHIVGLPAVLSRYAVGVVAEPGCGPDPPLQADLDRAIADEHVTVRTPRAGDSFRIGDLRFDVLSPDRCWHGTDSDPNNDSLVLMLTYAGRTVLFGAEPEEPAQQVMLDDGTPLHADVLKVPHHGAATSLPEFFDAVHPEAAVVSVGENPYGHPVASTLTEIAATSARIWRTDLDGTVTVTLGPAGITVSPANG